MAGLLAVTLGGCGGAETQSADAEQEMTALLGAGDVAMVTVADLATGISVSGPLRPALDVSITAPYPELLDEVLVKEGQVVGKGQVLARFRTEAIAPAAASAEAQLRSAAADYERMQNLFREGAVSQRDLDGAEAAWRAAEAAAALAQKRLEEAAVRAPFAGVVAYRAVQSGDRVGSGDMLFRVVNTARLELEATVPGEAAGQVRPGAEVLLTVSGAGDTGMAGRVARVNAVADAATRQVKVYAVVPNRDGRLVGDLYATGRVVLDEVREVLAVPSSGVRTASDGTHFAWVVVDGKAERREITPGLRDEGQDLTEVESGLESGEAVVIGPVEGLTAGQTVQVASQDGATPEGER
jgi:RND family efflux transporter MFP subunit